MKRLPSRFIARVERDQAEAQQQQVEEAEGARDPHRILGELAALAEGLGQPEAALREAVEVAVGEFAVAEPVEAALALRMGGEHGLLAGERDHRVVAARQPVHHLAHRVGGQQDIVGGGDHHRPGRAHRPPHRRYRRYCPPPRRRLRAGRRPRRSGAGCRRRRARPQMRTESIPSTSPSAARTWASSGRPPIGTRHLWVTPASAASGSSRPPRWAARTMIGEAGLSHRAGRGGRGPRRGWSRSVRPGSSRRASAERPNTFCDHRLAWRFTSRKSQRPVSRSSRNSKRP